MLQRVFGGIVLVMVTVGLASASDGFVDVPPDHMFEAEIQWLADEDITRGCNPPDNDMFCPDAVVTRGQMAAFLVRALGLTYVDPDVGFVDTVDSVFGADIVKLASAGITMGCNPPDNDMFCPDAVVTRGQMAAFLVRALGLTYVDPDVGFVDSVDSVFNEAIVKLASAGITNGCNPPANDRYCPDRTLTRSQMAVFLYRGVTDVPYIDGSALPDGTVGSQYSELLIGGGGEPPYTWTASSVPSGLVLESTGEVHGTPTLAGDYTLAAVVTDSHGRTASGETSLEIDEALLLTTDSIPEGVVNAPYALALAASGGEPPYVWSAVGLPIGLTLEEDGAISGAATAVGVSTVEIAVTDADGRSDTVTLECVIVDVLRVVTAELGDGTVGESYTDTLAAASGEPPYVWEVTGLPAGLTLGDGGEIGGIPEASGVFDLSVTVTDSDDESASVTLALDVYEPLVIETSWLPDGTVGESYERAVVVSGGKAPFAWSVSALPGIGIDATGTLVGVPTTAGGYNVEVTVTDAGGRTDVEWLFMDVDEPLVIPFGVFFDGELDLAYGMTLDGLGGEPPYEWSADVVPPGLGLSSSGTLSGTPTVLGNYWVALTLSDSDGREVSRTVTLFVAGISRASEASYGLEQGNEHSQSPRISADGRYVVFETAAGNLTPGDHDGTIDVYVFDTYTRVQTRASVAWNEAEVGVAAGNPDIDASGEKVVFVSDSPDFVFGDANGVTDVFLRDLGNDHTYMASVGSNGLQANGSSSKPRISDDGNRIMFRSDATNLVVADTNGFSDLFVNDRDLSRTWRVNVSSSGEQANGYCNGDFDLSGDGRWVAFPCSASNLVPNDANGKTDIFLRDIELGVTYLVSKTPLGVSGNDQSENPTVSADGRYVVFTSYASNLTGDDEDGNAGSLFIYDRVTDTVELISHTHDGSQFRSLWQSPVSEDGRLVLVTTGDDNVVPGDTDGSYDAFLIDRSAGTITRISEPIGPTSGLTASYGRDMSNDNGLVVLYSFSDYLVADDTNGYRDVFLAAVDLKL